MIRRFKRFLIATNAQISALPWTPWGADVLRHRAFRNRRVVIVGPAETGPEELRDVDVDGFDVVVRLNNGLILSAANPDLFGRRTDVLVHNLKEGGERSAGTIPADFLRASGVGQVVYPNWRTASLRERYTTKYAELKRDGGPPLRLMPQPLMEQLRADIGDRSPTVGASAITFFLASPLAELAIYGFTFFETPYAAGYNDQVVTAEDARAWVDAQGVHEPRSEKDAIRTRLESSPIPRITLGQHVARHLNGEV